METLDRSKTIGGHDNDTSQPALPVVHRRFANPAPLGLFSLSTSTCSFKSSFRQDVDP